MSAAPDLDGMPFETLLVMLQETVAELDGELLTLDAAVDAYERCVQIAGACTRQLDNAELRITRISATTQGIREAVETYSIGHSKAQRLLLGDDDDDLADLLDLDEDDV